MSTIAPVAPSPSYPFRFEITGGPTFQRLADAAKYHHDPDVTMRLKFTGVLTDTRTGTSRRVKLPADVYGFISGTDYERGEMTVFVTFRGFFIRFGPSIKYNWRDHKGLEILELGGK